MQRSLAAAIGAVLIAGVAVAVDDGLVVSSRSGHAGRSDAVDSSPPVWTVRAREAEVLSVDLVPQVPAPPAALRGFGTCDEALAALKREGLARVTPWGLPTTGDVGIDGSQGETVAGGPAGASGASDTGAHSTTNVQEPGVDEPDVVKNAGTLIVTLFDGQLRTLRRDGVIPEIADTLTLATPFDAEMLLVADRVVVLAPLWSHDGPDTRVIVVDVSDPTDLIVTTEVTLAGQYVSARSADGVVRLVVSNSGPSLEFTQPTRPDRAASGEALARNKEIVRASLLEDWLPEMRSTPTAGCAGLLAPVTFSGFGTTTVLTLDPELGEVVDAATVTARANEVYASADHLYVAAGVWPLEGQGPDDEVTNVHRFEISDPKRARYEASGSVSGHLLRPFFGGGGHMGQWAMSEHDGDLRVASTVGPWGQGASFSTVTVLRRQGPALVPIGAVTGLGPTEQIYAVRFMGTRGYVVTYRRVDPLYVLDLTVPTKPRLLGELKVPGYSAYLHPIAEGTLVGIGQDDPDEDGLADGTQVSVFDVADPAHPRRTAHRRLGERGTSSAVEGDHRAFTWWADPARALLPLRDHLGFDGLVALNVSGAAIAEVGRVEHRFGRDDGCVAPISRSRVIGGVVYTFSTVGVRANDVADFTPRGSVSYSNAPPCNPEPPSSTTSTTTPGPVPITPRQVGN